MASVSASRKKTFRVATSVGGKQLRMNLGYWPLMSVEQARELAMQALADCRRGVRPTRPVPPSLAVTAPTLRLLYRDCCRAKGIKASSQKRYAPLFKTHFGDWPERPVWDCALPEFSAHCRAFASSRGSALVELCRGVIGALVKYANALHGLSLPPFVKLSACGLLPERTRPRARVLQASEPGAWLAAVDQLPQRQRD